MLGTTKRVGWFFGIAIVAPAIALSTNRTVAQITPDSTLPNNSRVIPSGNTSIIEGGTQAGKNLFHSFQQFSVPTASTAFFNNALDVQNIISRVTGSSNSDIDGLIRTNGTANLFLLNPNGIVFRQNARLDVGGSFLASTARSLKFADGSEFSVTAPQTTPLLTVSLPIGLQFGGNAGSIQVQGNGQGQRSTPELIDTTVGLRVQPNQTLALVGGNLALEGGTLKTAGGRIELGSVAGSGLVSLTPINSGFALGYSGVPTFGDIQLYGGAAVDASGAGGGDIQVQGGRVTLKDGSQLEVSTLGAKSGGTLNVNASKSMEIVGATPDGQSFSALFALVYQGATGAGSKLTVKTEQLILRDGLISTSVNQGATGDGGNLTVETGQLIVQDGAQILANTFGEGNAGNLLVSARDLVEVIGATADNLFASALLTSSEEGAKGNGGNLTVKTGRLIVRDSAQIGAGTLGEGDGGSLTILADKSVEVIGTTPDGQYSSGLFTSVNPGATGNGGNLTVKTGQFIVRDGAHIAANTFGKGNAGNLSVSARLIELDNRAAISTTAASGNGGNITLQLQDLLLLRRNSQISTNAGTVQAGGNGGNISINAPDGFIVAVSHENSDITANAFNGAGGKIQINATGIFGIAPLSRQDLERLRPLDLDPSQLSTNDITAVSQQNPSLSGTVQINTPDTDPSRGLVQLPTNFIDPSQQIANGCTPGSRQSKSSFIATGRGGLPISPNQPLQDTSMLSEWVRVIQKPALTSNQVQVVPLLDKSARQIVEAQGWVVDRNGDFVLVAKAPQPNPRNSWQASVSCPAL